MTSEYEWYKAHGYAGALPDVREQWVNDRGYDDIYYWLGSLGYTGAINDRLRQWYADGGYSGGVSDMARQLYADAPTLGLNFKTGVAAVNGVLSNITDKVTFTRASTRTYYGSDGLLKTASVDEWPLEYDPVTLEPQGRSVWETRTNLLTYSEDFQDASWTKNAATIVPNTAVAPDGLSSADKLVETAVTDSHYTIKTITPASGTNYAATVFIKAAERGFAFVGLNGGGSIDFATVNLSTGVTAVATGSLVSHSAVDVGNGWWRVSIVKLTSSTAALNTDIRISADGVWANRSYLGVAGSGIYIWGAQLEAGAFATPYIPTTPSFTSRASGATYFDSEGVLQTASANLLTYSEEFDNAAWVKSNATISANAVVAPDGTTTADKLVEDTASAIHQVFQVRASSSGAYAFTLFAKAAERSYAFVRISDQTSGQVEVRVNLTTGVVDKTGVGTVGSWTVESYDATPLPDGWYRIRVSGTQGAGTNVAPAVSAGGPAGERSYLGDGTSGIYIWGAQLEQGTSASPYLKSVAAAAYEARNGYGLVDGAWVSQGLILEAAATNLLTYSEQFDNAAWTKTRASINPNVSVSPDGTLTADKLIEDTTATNTHNVIFASVSASNIAYTLSLFVKAAERTRGAILISDNVTSTAVANFDLVAKTVNTTGSSVWTGVSATLTELAGGWFRVVLTGTRNNTGATVGAIVRTADASGNTAYTGDGVSGIYIWGAQLETGSVATSYVPTKASFTSRASTATYFDSTGVLQTAAINQPRYGYGLVGGEWVSKGLELEAAATNLLLRSEEFDNLVSWTRTRVNVTPNAVVSPDGTLTADTTQATETNASGSYLFSQAVAVSATTYTASVFLKKGTGDFAMLQVFSGANGARQWFNLSTGAVTSTVAFGTGFTKASADVVNVGGGWYRCSFSVAVPAGNAQFLCVPSCTTDAAFAVNSGDVGYLWGAQLEAGSTATSYIPTTTTTVTRAADVSSSAATTRAADVSSSVATTRAADVAVMTGTNFSDWYNATEGTLVVEHTGAAGLSTGSANTVFQIAYSLNSGNSMGISQAVSGSHRNFTVFDNAVTSCNLTGASLVPGQLYKVAGAYKANDFAVSRDGATVQTDAAGTVPTVDKVGIGVAASGTQQWLNGFIRSITYYPKRLSNAQLQALSS